MPYIRPEARNKLDGSIGQVIEALRDGLAEPGNLNYVITRICLGLEPDGYTDIAYITGVLENVKQEFYRRTAAPYENRKIQENGDVYMNEAYPHELQY